jgi:hypothetical protein
MSLKAFVDIRFGDPVTALSINSYAVAYGTTTGRLVHFNFEAQIEKVLDEISEEVIRGLWLTEENILYVTIGDLKCVIID